MSVEKNPTTGLVIDVFGPSVEYLTSPEDEQNDFCVMKGTIPPGVYIPLHSHPDTEDFLIISGSVEALTQVKAGYQWIEATVGDYVHVPGGEPHAWRNMTDEPVVMLIITTRKIGQFFEEVGRPITDTQLPPTPEDLERFARISAEYGYWNATPEENAAVGIQLPAAVKTRVSSK